jgi:type IX secretion system PorP/SprF family membrane protein
MVETHKPSLTIKKNVIEQTQTTTVTIFFLNLLVRENQNHYPLRLLLVFPLLLFAQMRPMAQNYSLSNNYISNFYLINPAEAATNRLHVFGTYRNQWVGINGSPSIISAGANTLLNNTRVGVGFRVSSVSLGILKSTDAMVTYAYAVPFENKSHLYFGLSGGFSSNAVNWSDIEDPNDQALLNRAETGMNPAASFGAVYKTAQGFHVGITLPSLMSATGLEREPTISPLDNLLFSVYYSRRNDDKSTGRYNTGKSKSKKKKGPKDLPLEAFALYRYSPLGNQLELAAKYNFHSSLWLSATYRQYAGIIPGLGLNAGNLFLSYFYEFGIAGDLPLKTHELMLGLRLGTERKFRERVPPAVAKRAAAQQAIAKATPAPVKTAPAKQPVASTSIPAKQTPASTTPVKTEPQKPVSQPVVTEAKPPAVTQPVATETNKQPEAEEETEMLKPSLMQPQPGRGRFAAPVDTVVTAHAEERKELDQHIDDHDEGTHADEHSEPINERHEFVKRGTHHEELEEGTFVIAGAFKSRANAEHYAQTLTNMKFPADFGHLSVKEIWYVFVSEETDVEEAKKDRNVLQKNKIFKDVWLLTVQQ